MMPSTNCLQCRLLGFDIQLLRQPSVFFVLFLYEPGELRTAATDRLLVSFEKMLPDGGISERLADLAIEAVNNRGRRGGWNEHADPIVEDHSVDADLLKGRYVRQSRRTPFRRLRK